MGVSTLEWACIGCNVAELENITIEISIVSEG